MIDIELKARNILANAFGCDATDLSKAEVCCAVAVLRSQESDAPNWSLIATAPKDGTEVLIAGGTYSYGMWTDEKFDSVSIARWHGDHWRGEDRQSHDEWYSHNPTHWQHLPAPPEIPNE